MTGRAFLKLVSRKKIPLSCIAIKFNCQLKTLKALKALEKVPYSYVLRFIYAFRDTLTERDIDLLTQ